MFVNLEYIDDYEHLSKWGDIKTAFERFRDETQNKIDRRRLGAGTYGTVVTPFYPCDEDEPLNDKYVSKILSVTSTLTAQRTPR